MNQSRLYRVGILLVFSALICACTQETKPTTPKFTGRLLFLSGDPTNGANLSELTAAGTDYSVSTITGGVFEAVASPDQTHLLYTTKDEIMQRDLRSGAVKSLVKGDNFCLAWAPDGNHFSYRQRSTGPSKLYESDLNGQSKLILEDPNGSLSCAQWIAADRLVFDRFVGTQQKTKSAEPIKPNTTTVATIGDPVKLHDSPKKWTIESVCAKANNGFLRPADGGQLLIAKNIDHYETLDPSPASCSECRFVGYAAQSCVPFFVEQPTSSATEIFYLNPTNLQKQRPGSINRTFSLSAKMLIKSSAKSIIVGDAGWLLLIDAESGEITPLLPKPPEPATPADAKAPIVWIEN